MKKFFFALFFAVAAGTATARPALTYDDIAAGKFTPKSISGLNPMPDGERYTVQVGCRIESYNYSDGKLAETIFDGEAFSPAVKFSGYSVSADGAKVLLATNPRPIYRHSFSADYLVYDRASKRLAPLSGEGSEQQAAFSPDGSKVGFVRDNNLYVTNLSDMSVRAVTSDGRRNHIINGLPDWVYEEEYGFSRAFWFSPSGGSIAWLRFDESRVREYTFMTYRGRLYPEPYTYKYPKAGEDNSMASLLECDLASGVVSPVYDGKGETYIPRAGYTPEGSLWYFKVNRLQNRFEVVAGGSTVYVETAMRYVERPDDKTVTFLPGGGMLVVSERSGWRHLYRFDRGKDGVYALKNPVTSGEWDVEELVGVAGGKAWYVSSEGSSIRRNLWCVDLDGRGKRLLSSGQGNCRIDPGSGMKHYISYFSNVSTPLRVTVHRGDGTLERTIEDNAALAVRIKESGLPVKEFFSIPGDDGTPLNAYIIKPAGFDPQRPHPVLVTQYSGPGSQEVLDRWTIGWEDVLVQRGYVVVSVDPRGTGGRGRDFRQVTYLDLGGPETADHIAAAKWIAAQNWADPARIGIYGWSYGGFMALNCILKGNDVFSMAIAVAPVTSWRFYDTVYTEIYNGLPQDNPQGYDRNSPLNFAAGLKGKLLIVHGSADDNVHPQNTFEMASALVREGKLFDMMVYPDNNHSMMPTGRHNVRRKMIEYVTANL